MRHTSTLKRLSRRFRNDTSGAVAIIFALATLPLMIGAGMAIDIVRSSDAQSELQAALDAGALAAAAIRDASDEEREEAALKSFAANFQAPHGVTVTPAVNIAEGAVSMSAEFPFQTAFMRVAGYNTIDIGSSVTVNIPGEKKAEIALVLDYSGSMGEFTTGGQKYKVMRDAAIDMVNDLTDEASADRVRFGLVPFSHHVNVTLPAGYVAGQGTTGTWTGCTQDRPYPHNLTDDVPNPDDDGTKWGQPHAPEHAGSGCGAYEPNSLTVRPISEDHEGIVQQLNDMRPYAWTHISLGFSFGWQLLAPNGLFGDVAEYDDEETMKVIVLLTDGRQTEPSFGPGGSRTVAHGEQNLETLCENAKAKNVTVITVAFDLRHNATETRLRNCSTDPAKHFFEADDGAELTAAFEEIRGLLQQAIYISK